MSEDTENMMLFGVGLVVGGSVAVGVIVSWIRWQWRDMM